MYDTFYGLEERPFSLLPDPDFLFLSEQHRTALDMLDLAVMNQSGFCVLSGEIGAGKTTLVRELLNRLDAHIQVGLVSNTHPSFGELMLWVMAAYGLDARGMDRLEMHKRFIDFVIGGYAGNKRTLLIIDEAQNLSVAALEELRMLSNVNSDKDLVLQVILVGQQQLRENLQQPALEQFAQRIGVDFHLAALNEDETRRYIHHRIRRAGGSESLFNAAACRIVHRASDGIPRLINRICDLALVYGYAEQCAVITAPMMLTVINDQQIGNVLEAARHGVDARTRPETPRAAAISPPAGAPGETADDTAADIDSPTGKEGIVAPGSVGNTGSLAAEQHTNPARSTRRQRVEVGPVQPASPPVEKLVDASPSTVEAHELPKLDQHRLSESSELHRLVVGAEQRVDIPRASRRGLMLSIVGVLLLSGLATTAWLKRDAWLPPDMPGWDIANWYETLRSSLLPAPQQVQSAGDGVTRFESPAKDAPQSGPVRESQSQTAATAGKPDVMGQSISVAIPTPDAVPDSAKLKHVAVGVDERVAPETQAMQRIDNGETLPAEALKLEIERLEAEALKLERERLAKEALKLERRRLARIKEESEQLERDRLAAERELAERLKSRLALEQKVRREREKMLETRRAVEQANAARKRAEQASQVVVETAPVPVDLPETRVVTDVGRSVERPAPQQDSVARRVETSAVPVPGTGSIRTPPVLTSEAELLTTEADPPVTDSSKFQSNPCDGPSARFMSTCF